MLQGFRKKQIDAVTNTRAYFVLGAKGDEIMKVFLAGATGAIGKRLVPLLIESGHTVVGTTRNREKAGLIEDAGGRKAGNTERENLAPAV
jgi:hypothetical protein